jgi:iron complex outermembrane receptor protein
VSEKAQVAVSGPIDSAGTLRYRASVNFYNTDGFLTNKIYNAEFSTGGFLWRALPRRYGVDLTYKF